MLGYDTVERVAWRVKDVQSAEVLACNEGICIYGAVYATERDEGPRVWPAHPARTVAQSERRAFISFKWVEEGAERFRR